MFDRLLYKGGLNDTGNSIAITTDEGAAPVYSPDGKSIVHSNRSQGSRLYKKDANDTSNGVSLGIATDLYSVFP